MNDEAQTPERNDVIAQTEAKIESQLTPDNRGNYIRIVTAGMAAALKGGPNSIIAGITKTNDPVTAAAKGAVNICLLMRKHSKGTMPLKAMVPACTTLMLKALEFAERAGSLTVDEKIVSRATRIMTDYLLRSFGLTPQKLHAAASRVHDLTRDPVAMQKMRQAGGMDPAPNAKRIAAEPA